MARIEVDPNYSSPSFSRATAPADAVKLTDIQQVAAALSTHNHDGAGKGLQVGAPGSIPGASLVVGSVTSSQIADGTIQTIDLADGSVTTPKLAGNLTLTGTTTVSTLVATGNETVGSQLQVNGYTTLSGGATTANLTSNGDIQMTNHSVLAIAQLTFQSGANLYASTDHVVVNNHLQVSATLLVGSNATVTGSLTSTGGNLYLNARHIYDGGDGVHVDYDLRIDSSHDVYTNAIRLANGASIDTAGGSDMNYYGPNGSGNHKFQHADHTWMGTQAAAFQIQSTRESKSGAVTMTDADAMARVRQPLPAYTWQTPNVNGPAGQSSVGFMADDMVSVVPEVVGYNSDDSIFGLEYGQLTAILWAALRDLDARCQARGI